MERTTTREGELLPGREAEALRRRSRLETMMEDVLAAADRGEAERLLVPVDAYFGGYPALTVDEAGEKRVRNGGSVRAAGGDGTYRVYGPGGAFLMLGRLERGTLKTIKSFYEV